MLDTMRAPAFAIAIAVLSGSSHAQQQSRPRTESQAQQQPQINTADLNRRVKFLEAQVRSLQTRTAYKYVALDCNSGKYDEFQFSSGSLVYFASCTKIEPYLEGHRITLSVGNPYAFTFSNIKGSLSYGKDLVDSWERKVDVSITETMRGGSWTSVTIIVNPSKAEDMRYLGLELNAQTAGSLR